MISDKYLRKRGGTAKIINVSCSNCGELLFVYQKDGPGWLKRCYLNRILEPKKYSMLQGKTKNLKDFGNLVCEKCGIVIGSPMKHKDERLAFNLIRGKFKRTLNKDKRYS
ncbi:MAG: hypothetical protein V1888_04050 [archaeon]